MWTCRARCSAWAYFQLLRMLTSLDWLVFSGSASAGPAIGSVLIWSLPTAEIGPAGTSAVQAVDQIISQLVRTIWERVMLATLSTAAVAGRRRDQAR